MDENVLLVVVMGLDVLSACKNLSFAPVVQVSLVLDYDFNTLEMFCFTT
jgi:hypothetical protein